MKRETKVPQTKNLKMISSLTDADLFLVKINVSTTEECLFIADRAFTDTA